MDNLRIRMIGKRDRNNDEYYFTTCHSPCLVDLSNCVIHFFPDEEGPDSFGGDLVIRHYDKQEKPVEEDRSNRNRRNHNILPSPDK